MAASDQTQLGLGFDRPVDDRVVDGRVVAVRPDVVGIDRLFHYTVPGDAAVAVGDVVRIALGPRRVRGWVVGVDVEPDPGVQLRPIARWSSRGPTPELVALADWAAWRWAGRPAHLLRTATPPANVTALPAAAPTPATGPGPALDPVLAAALVDDRAVLPLGPGEDRYPLARAAARTEGGHALLLCPGVAEATALAARLRRDGVAVALLAGQEPASALAREWARARAGATVVGTRAAAWAPLPDLGRVVVFDEHDEGYQGDQTPTWNARDVAAERARRAGCPCLLVSPTPSPEARLWGRVVERSRAAMRAGWPRVEVIDKRALDPDVGPLFSPRVVQLVRGDGRVLCILNRTGRVRLLSCARCGNVAACDRCGGAVSLESGPDGDRLACPRDDHRRPPVCLGCGGTRFKHLRLGVSRAREELEVLAGRPVGEVTAATGRLPDAPVLIGTEALLRRAGRADAVVFLDIDQHLLAVRHRAGEQALALLALAGRLVARGGHGRIVVQTRDPDHPALVAAREADPERFAEEDLALRRLLRLPPVTALATVSGAGAGDLLAALGEPEGVVVQGPVDGTWRLVAPDHRVLCDALAATPRPEARVRIAVDPHDA